ncbi:putative ribonuclease H-like domain-containing protein [Tanacetum coccineum]
MRQFSVARTPQQNRVAERRNKTLLEAARTMLADSKLPTTFWTEAVNIACYVQNRVLVVKPHNKTPYELFHGRTPTLSFIRPFGCPVTILYTINHLGKFDGKADEGFFVGYSLNSNAFRVFNSRTRIVEENLHIRFSESTPNVVGSGPDWLFDIDALTRIINYEPIVAGTQSNGFASTNASNNADPKSSHDDGSNPSSNDGKKVDEDPRKESECNDQEKEDNVNNTNNVNAASTNEVNDVGAKTSIELPFDPNMPALEDYSIFDSSKDDEDDGAEPDMNNLDTTIQVSPIPTTRIHKDHPLDQVIRDLQSATQTRRMTKNLQEHGFVSTIQQRTNHKGLQNCLFACFLSWEEPKKDERGIVIRNKARLVAQGCTQEEGIDYNEVFAPVARIKAIRLFLAYDSFKDFMVYQMDVKSAFLYGTIEKEVYVCQPPRFEDPYIPDRVYKKELLNAFEKIMHEKFQMSSMGELTFFLGLQVQQKKDGIFICQDKYVIEILKKFRLLSRSKLSMVSTVASPSGWEKIIITESTVRRDLKLEDAEATNQKFNFLKYIFESMVRNLDNVSGIFLMYPRVGKGFSGRVTPLFPIMVMRAVYKELGDSLVRAATSASSLEAEQDSGNITKTRSKATLNKVGSLGTTLGGGPRCQETMGDTIAQTRFENVSKLSNDLLLARGNTLRSGEDSLKLNELMVNVFKFLQPKYSSLIVGGKADKRPTQKLRLNSFEKLSASVVSSGDEEDLGEDASKQGRRINAIDEDDDITLVNDQDDNEMFDADTLIGDEVFTEQEVDAKDVNLTIDEVTLAQALAALKSGKPKVKGDVIEEPSVPISAVNASTKVSAATTTTATISTPRKGIVITELVTPTIMRSSQQPSQVKFQDKGKGKMVEPEKPMKKKDQISFDEESAKILQAEFDEEVRLARKKAEKEQEANIAFIEEWDNIQAKIDANHQERRKHFAAKRAEEKRNKPPTLAQQRKIICTYLKNMDGKNLKELKNKSFDSIKKMFDRAFKKVNTFVDFRTDLVEDSSKRAGEELEQESTKTQKVDEDKDTTELKSVMEVILDEEEVAIDAIPLATKPPIIIY